MQKIAIIVRNETLNKCTAKGCLNAFSQRIDAFANYSDQVRLVGFTQESGDLEKKITKLKQSGVEVVHLSSCLRGKSEDYESLAKRLSQDFSVVGYTHGSFHGRTRKALCLEKQAVDVDCSDRQPPEFPGTHSNCQKGGASDADNHSGWPGHYRPGEKTHPG